MTMHTVSPGVTQRVRAAREAMHNIYDVTPRIYRGATIDAHDAAHKAVETIGAWNKRSKSVAVRLSARFPKCKKQKGTFAERVARAAKAIKSSTADARADRETPRWVVDRIEDAETAVKKLQERMNR